MKRCFVVLVLVCMLFFGIGTVSAAPNDPATNERVDSVEQALNNRIDTVTEDLLSGIETADEGFTEQLSLYNLWLLVLSGALIFTTFVALILVVMIFVKIAHVERTLAHAQRDLKDHHKHQEEQSKPQHRQHHSKASLLARHHQREADKKSIDVNLVGYIRKLQRQGYPQQHIYVILQSQGVSEHKIANAMRTVNNHQAAKNTKTK